MTITPGLSNTIFSAICERKPPMAPGEAEITAANSLPNTVVHIEPSTLGRLTQSSAFFSTAE